MKSIEQQCEHLHYKVLISGFHLRGSGFRSFLGLAKFAFGSG